MKTMKKDRDSCSTGSSKSGIHKNILNKSPTPVCMFYFSHPFGISTPSSSKDGSERTTRKSSKYTTKTYLVTEIQKNNSDGSQDEFDTKKHTYTDRELIPWPKKFLLPPLIQLLQRKHGKKLPDIDSLLKQVRKEAWNTPKSYRSHNFWSRGSSVSSDDFSSLASPDSVDEKFKPNQAKLKHRNKTRKAVNMDDESLNARSSNVNAQRKTQILLKRRYSVPEIIMRKYSLAQQKSYEQNVGILASSLLSETINKSSNGQSSINKKPTPSQPVSTSNTRTSSPIKYFIPLSPQPTSIMASANSYEGSGSFLNNEISMRKQTLLRRLWSREFQHAKHSGSWSPPLRRSTHQPESRLRKFHTFPEIISSTCEKCKELGVLARNFDEEFCENKEDKSQQTDFDLERNPDKAQKNCCTSPSPSSSTIVLSAIVKEEPLNSDQNSNHLNLNSSSLNDSNGNSIIINMTALQEHSNHPHLKAVEDPFRLKINDINNSDMIGNSEKFLRKQFSTQIDDNETVETHFDRILDKKVDETEMDEYISKMLIENLNTVIKTVNENLQASGEHNLVKIDYFSGAEEGGEEEERGYYNNNFRNQHDISIQMRNAKNGDTASTLNSNQPASQTYIAVERDTCQNADEKSQELLKENPDTVENQNFYGYYAKNRNLSDNSEITEQLHHLEVTAIINSGTSYPEVNNPESIFIPRLIGPKTESMEVNPSSSSAQEDDEFDGMADSDEEDISDVDSLDDIVTIRAKRMTDLAHHQHRKDQMLFRQTHLKGQAFFVPIVDSEQHIDEHIVVADTMPEKLKEKLIMRQKRRDMKKQSDMNIKQWRMQKFIERKMGEVRLVNDYIEDFSTGGAFKIIGMPKKLGPIETNVYKREPGKSGGWMSKSRQAQTQAQASKIISDPVPEKTAKNKKLRNEIGMLESYKIDGRGNMQIQNPGKSEKAQAKPKIKRNTPNTPKESKKPLKTKTKTPLAIPSRKSNTSSKRTVSNIPTSSASSVEAVDARRRQVMKDVQQMSIYKNDLTPDPDSGPSRKMWKTEIQEGDKHIEILEIVECIDGTSSHQQTAPEYNNCSHLFPPSISSQKHKYYHVSSSSSHPTIVNKTFSVRTSGFGVAEARDTYPSKIPLPVYRYMHYKEPFNRYEPRDTSPSNNNYSSSTDAEESSADSGSTQQPSKVDRMIANLLMGALQSPDELGIDFVQSPKNRKSKRRSQSPVGADSSSTGYYTADSSRRSASNSAGKYQHRFEVIPEEKSSFSVDSCNDDFIDDEEEDISNSEKLNSINNDWKSRKNLQNNDIKTKSVTPQEKQLEEDKNEKSKEATNNQNVSPEKSPPKHELKSATPLKFSKVSPVELKKSLSKVSYPLSGPSSPVRLETIKKPLTTFSEKIEQINESGDMQSIVEEDISQPKSEDSIHSLHPEHTNLIHQFMSNKSSTSSSNNHFHYHLYQYQTHNCCFNLFDQSKTSSTVTTAASNENFSSIHSQSMENSCQTADFSQSRNTLSYSNDKLKNDTSSKFNENLSRITTSESEFPSFNDQKVNFHPSVTEETQLQDENDSKSQNSEKIIVIEFLNDNYKKPKTEDEQDDCSCTKKYIPYKINEKNVWQVYETSDCKYIQSKHYIDEIFKPPSSLLDCNKSSDYNPLLHSRSNFSNQIIYHTINQEETVAGSTQDIEPVNRSTSFNLNSKGDSMYTPTFNIKSEALEGCKCIDEMTEDNASKVDGDLDDMSDVSRQQFARSSESSHQPNMQSGKLLNRPQASNNIPRDQVKPVEREIQNEIIKSGVRASMKNSSKLVRLPSPLHTRQALPRKNKSYEDDSELSDFSSNESQQASVKDNKKSKKTRSNQSSVDEHSSLREKSSLERRDGKNIAIPNINQGWSVTVAGTHPDSAPDVEMKLSFPKAKESSTLTDSKLESETKGNPEVFYYRNNQLLPASSDVPNQEGHFDRYDHKPYHNQRRSLSLARIDSGISGMVKPKSYNLPNLYSSRSYFGQNQPRATARNAFKVECTRVSTSKTIAPSRRSQSLDIGNQRLSLDSSRSQASPSTPSEMLSVVGSEMKKTLKPRVKTMSEKDLTKRHLNCFTRSNGHF